ncbi:hypothetical protein CORC01_01436 [Colletotrichum orchidophilum]|uniref:Uncharacterized protein n=1 Tax=Colletotrichum orchidophilum TaxID=1209926 RepID=A0A1G4BPZ1_9PEZI|nr:uncharacterized protein CORC01_01436 [Colletotrichum orchidophilum]OHF03383.1 hypothetical protein CORC01_01436 [Colletotrichum orchidophilum]
MAVKTTSRLHREAPRDIGPVRDFEEKRAIMGSGVLCARMQRGSRLKCSLRYAVYSVQRVPFSPRSVSAAPPDGRASCSPVYNEN